MAGGLQLAALEASFREVADWPQPFLAAGRTLASKNEAYSQGFADVLAALDGAGKNVKNLLARVSQAAELSRSPVALLLAEKPCPSVEEAANEGHDWHMQIGRVKNSLLKGAKHGEAKVVGIIDKMREIARQAMADIERSTAQSATQQ
ncbi:unnamed protein product [Amoebophrya sp. A25]|nr:unnamed protein product [Amoebophrya sp. A25]|eukprot:GSA25T00014103001.1